jgi:hypothetical protein
MFHVGRFDPDAATAKTKLKSASSGVRGVAKKKRASGDGKEKLCKKTKKDINIPVDMTMYAARDDDKSHDAATSSSVPSSSESDDSSSVESTGHNKSKFKVIAQSQPIVGEPQKANRKKRDQEEEEVDDFDADFDIIENAAASHSAKDETIITAADSAAKRAMQLSKVPIEEAAATWNLPKFLVDNLKADSYTHFFPIQCMVIPDVIESERNAHLRGARDVCCHAPTGSGKTLAFVLPILTVLHKKTPTTSGCARGLRRLRALVVLPGRDLAKQVYDVFTKYAKGSQIKIGLAVGGGSKKGDLANERRSLVVETYNEAIHEIRTDDGVLLRRAVGGGLFELASSRLRHSFDPTSLSKALDAYDGTLKDDSGPQAFPRVGGRSAVDVLVATPGRLMDHLDTPGFTLQHLKYLVIDEADRLVNQPYQNWVGRVLETSNSCNIFNASVTNHTSLSEYINSPLQVAPDENAFIIDPITHRCAAGVSATPHVDASLLNEGVGSVDDFHGQSVPLRKMVSDRVR